VLFVNATSMHLMRLQAHARVVEQLMEVVFFRIEPVEATGGPYAEIKTGMPERTRDAFVK